MSARVDGPGSTARGLVTADPGFGRGWKGRGIRSGPMGTTGPLSRRIGRTCVTLRHAAKTGRVAPEWSVGADRAAEIGVSAPCRLRQVGERAPRRFR